MKTVSRGAVGILILTAVLAAGAVSAATVSWDEHYRLGLALADQGRWEEAIEELAAAARVEPRPQRQARAQGATVVVDYDPHYHQARCLVELGRWIQAGGHLRLSARARVTPREKLDPLRRRIEDGLRGGSRPAPPPARVSELWVTTTPVADVTLDGDPLGRSPVGPVQLPPGQHLLRASADGFQPVERTVTGQPDRPLRLDLRLSPLPATPATAPATPVRRATVAPPTPRARPTTEGAPVASAPAPPADVTPTLPPALPTAPSPAPEVTAPVDLSRPSSRLPLATAGGVVVAAGLLAFWLRRRRRPPVVTAVTRIHDGATWHAQGGPTPPAEFEVLSTLGRGGMATTHRARRRRDGVEVALKIPHDSCLTDQTFVSRFLREGQLGEQLHHPGIVRVLQVGEHDGRPFMAMELVQGSTLKSAIREGGALPVRRALEIARDIAEALDYAHAKGVVHRDLKPDNIMLQPGGAVKVMDYGIARVGGHSGLTSTNLFLGTPLYAAPEMVDPKTVDHRIDLYALGIILFEMLQGVVPFYADSPYRVLEMHLRQPLPALDTLHRPVPAPVWAVVTRLCEKDRERRYPSAELLLVDLARLLDTLPPDPPATVER